MDDTIAVYKSDLKRRIGIFEKMPIRFQIFSSPWRIVAITILSYIVFGLFWILLDGSLLNENIQVGVILVAIWTPFLAFLYSLFLAFFPKGSHLFTHANVIAHFTSLLQKKQKINIDEMNLSYLMEQDKKSIGVHSEKIMDIRTLIIGISEDIRNYEHRIKHIEKFSKKSFIYKKQDIFLLELDILIQEEKKELCELATRISFLVSNWTQLHQKELLEVEQELEQQTTTTENLSGQGALDLQRVRLHEHIENLNKITNIL
ncbi:MAG: hypothetical protein PHH70_02400 [Candidatus Gracilibacteria bacterium]|nr:hypothetical protein [Candidatus Gracilibacteria bacterium]